MVAVQPMVRVGRRRRPSAETAGLAIVVLLVTAAFVVPFVIGWDVHAGSERLESKLGIEWLPPLHAWWGPRLGPSSAAAVLIVLLVVTQGPRLCEAAPWRRLLLVCWLVGVGWLVSLALVDGADGLRHALDVPNGFLPSARGVQDVPAMIGDYIARIPHDAPRNWPVQPAGHPPGALLLFVGLVRAGLDGLGVGLLVAFVAAGTPVAVLVTLRALDAELVARRAAPLLVLSPMAVFAAVSADGLFMAISAWGLALLASAAVRRSHALSFAAGLVLGCCLFLSYGYVLLGILAVAVLVAARTAYPLPAAVVGAAVVVVAFAVGGFAWWQAFPVLQDRYWAGLASDRPTGYWVWGNLAALCLSAGLVIGPATAGVVRRARGWIAEPATRAPAVLSLAALLTIVVADVSLMSKAETERIWLPFMPWLLVAAGLLSPRWRRVGLVLQGVLALLVQHLIHSWW